MPIPSDSMLAESLEASLRQRVLDLMERADVHEQRRPGIDIRTKVATERDMSRDVWLVHMAVQWRVGNKYLESRTTYHMVEPEFMGHVLAIAVKPAADAHFRDLVERLPDVLKELTQEKEARLRAHYPWATDPYGEVT